jgi:glycosyltransferase involved in cell wall biosynthesis
MKIGIDGRSLEEKRTGIGRYLESILREWSRSPAMDDFLVYYMEHEPDDPFFSHSFFSRRRIFYHHAGQRDIFAGELDRDPPDVFFSPLYDLPYSLKGPAVITIHDMIHEAWPEAFNDLQLEYLRERTDFSVGRAQRIITDSHFSLGEIVRKYPRAKDRIHVIPLAPSPIFTPGSVNDAFLQSRFDISGPFLLYVGAITPKRHILPILEAFSLIGARFHEWTVLAIGRNVTYPPEDLQRIVEEYNRQMGRRAVIYEEYISNEELLCLYRGAKVFIYPSTYEGFGMPPLEAMACGAPVITTSFTSIPEVVGDAALIVESLNAPPLAEAMEAMMGDEGLRDDYRRRGFIRKEKFSWSHTAEETLRVIRHCKGD